MIEPGLTLEAPLSGPRIAQNPLCEYLKCSVHDID